MSVFLHMSNSAIRASPGGIVSIVIESAESPGTLLLQVYHSLDSSKCLMEKDISVVELPHSHEVKIPKLWEAGMYSLRLSGRGKDGVAAKAWQGIMMVVESKQDTKAVCGAQVKLKECTCLAARNSLHPRYRRPSPGSATFHCPRTGLRDRQKTPAEQ